MKTTYHRLVFLLAGLVYLPVMAQTPGTLKWSFDANGEIYGSPSLGLDGVVYIGINDNSEDGNNDNRVIALNPDGSLKWEYEVSDWVETAPALSVDGVLYIGSWDGFLYALNCETGEELWKFETFGVIGSSPAIAEDGSIYFGNGENALYAVNPDGSPKWVNGGAVEASPYLFNDWVEASPALDSDGNIWVGDLFGYLAQIAPDKTELWKFDLEFGITTSPAIGADGTIYYGDEAGDILAIDPDVPLDENWQPKWIFDTGLEDIESSPVIGPDGTIYIGSGSDSVYALDGQTGAIKSGWPFTEPSDVLYSTPAIAENGTVYIGSGDKNLYAISSAGSKLWAFATGGFVDSSPAIGPDGTVYFGSTDGVVYAVYGDSPLSFSRWPKFRANNEAIGRVDPYRAWVAEEGLVDPDPYADPDDDGLENILEWAFCTEPLTVDNNDVMYPSMLSSSNGYTLEVSWNFQAKGVFVQFSNTLGDWETINLKSIESYTWIDSVEQAELGEKTQYVLNIDPVDSPPRFFRLKAIQH